MTDNSHKVADLGQKQMNQSSEVRIKPLQDKAGFNLWKIRTKALLQDRPESLWDEERNAPKDSAKSSSIIINLISDHLLEQVADTDLQATTIWNHLKTTFVTNDLSAKATALTSLVSFNYELGPF